MSKIVDNAKLGLLFYCSLVNVEASCGVSGVLMEN